MMLCCCAQCCPIQTSAEPGWEHGGTTSNPLLTLRDKVKGSPQIITPLESLSLCNPFSPVISFPNVWSPNCSHQWSSPCLLAATADAEGGKIGGVRSSGCSLEWPPCHPLSAPNVCIDTQTSPNSCVTSTPLEEFFLLNIYIYIYTAGPQRPVLRMYWSAACNRAMCRVNASIYAKGN